MGGLAMGEVCNRLAVVYSLTKRGASRLLLSATLLIRLQSHTITVSV